MTDSAEVVVVGAGLAGLTVTLHLCTVTLHLCAAWLDVRLLEAAADVDGRVRTDLVDGFLLDHGFQVHDTAYPEPARVLDVGAFDLRPFLPGAPGIPRRSDTPRDGPSPTTPGPGRDVAGTGRLFRRQAPGRPARGPSRAHPAPEAAGPTGADRGRGAAVGGGVRRRHRALLPAVPVGGVPRASGSPRRAGCSRCCSGASRAAGCVPNAGTAEIPRRLAARLPPGVLRLRTPVAAVDGNGAVMAGGGRARRALVSSRVVAADADERAVRAQLRQWYGPDVDGWEHLAAYRVAASLPDRSPPVGRLRKPVQVGRGRYVAGDWRDSASTQGAMVSGRRAARAVLADIGLRVPVHDRVRTAP